MFKAWLPALGLLTAAAVVTPAHAGKVKIKNCLQERVYACAFNGKDNSFAIPASMKGLKPGRHDALKCTSQRCKVFLATSGTHRASYVTGALAMGAVGGAGGWMGGMVLGGYASMSSAAATGTMAAGGVGGAAIAYGVVKGIEGLDNGKRCKKIVKDAQKGKAGDRLKASGKWTLLSTTVDGNTKVALVKGHVPCNWDEATVADDKKKDKKRKKKRKKRGGVF